MQLFMESNIMGKHCYRKIINNMVVFYFFKEVMVILDSCYHLQYIIVALNTAIPSPTSLQPSDQSDLRTQKHRTKNDSNCHVLS